MTFSDSQTLRGHAEVFHSRRGLPRFFETRRRGDPVTLVFLGGSITAGAGASDEAASWRARVTARLQAEAAPAPVLSINAGIGGTPSSFGAFRLETDVLRHRPDLVLVEFAVNDGELTDTQIDRSLEGIVRHARRACPSAEIFFVDTLHRDHLADYAAGALPRTVKRHEVIADYYGIPSLNLGAAIDDRLRAGALIWDEFSADDCHPTDAGHELYAELVNDALAEMREGAALKAIAPRDRLPALFSGSIERGALLDFPDAGLGPGWSRRIWVEHGRAVPSVEADAPGALLGLEFAGRVLGLSYVLGPDTGAFEFSVDGGPWIWCDSFDPWAVSGDRHHSRVLAWDLAPGRHRLRLRPAPSVSGDRGTCLRLLALLAERPGSED